MTNYQKYLLFRTLAHILLFIWKGSVPESGSTQETLDQLAKEADNCLEKHNNLAQRLSNY